MYAVLKRGLDILGSALALLVLTPILLPVGLLLWATGEHEVFYRQMRIGHRNERFGIWKFATMLKDSPNLGTGTLTVRGDPRVTAVGRVLRATKLNEIPQLFNILTGQMSFVGPRPQVQGDYDCYPDHVRASIYTVRPGITGIGSIVFRDEERLLSRPGVDPRAFYAEKIAPYKGELEMWYLRRASLLTDARLVLHTAWAVVAPTSDRIFRAFPDLPPKPDWFDERADSL
jgi:lipopolysaccharide/colanic/teichoic acid biosynthesis glycosyltransferase